MRRRHEDVNAEVRDGWSRFEEAGNAGLTTRVWRSSTPVAVSAAPRVLVVASLFQLAYRVLRCVTATGATAYVLGNAGSRGFRYSRFCAQFIESSIPFDEAPCREALRDINRQVDQLGIDIVIGGDAPTTRMIAGFRDEIRAQCFPTPDLATFDLLNDKWAFIRICDDLGIPCPPTRLFRTREELLHEINTGALCLPAVAKPLSWEGARGVITLDRHNAVAAAQRVNYAPVLVQDFIDGEDIGASTFSDAGEMKAFVLHCLKRATYSTFHRDEVVDHVSRIVRKMRVTGILNFDMRLTRDGRLFYLECNPRVFYKINLSMLVGINFIAQGLARQRSGAEYMTANGVAVRFPKAMLLTCFTPWRFTSLDLAMLRYLAADPVPYLRELVGAEWEP